MRWLAPGSYWPSAASLVAANLVPLVGVALLGWSLLLVLVLYWVESGIIGLLNVYRIATARGPEPEGELIERLRQVHTDAPGLEIALRAARIGRAVGRWVLIPFFVVHYGIFWIGHGIFIWVLPLFGGFGTGALDPGAFGTVDPTWVVAAALGMLASHGWSIVTNWIGRREYLTVTPQEQMGRVYGRVVVLHVTIIFGAMLIGATGAPIAALVVLVAAKTVLDLGLHLREHRGAAERAARRAPAAPASVNP